MESDLALTRKTEALALTALMALVALPMMGCPRNEPRATSALLVVADTLRADRLGTYGHSRPTSPELDRWAARGAVFELALAPSPWTLPSTASIHTGRLPSGHGAGTRGARDFTAVRSGVPVLAEVAAGFGLATAAFATNDFLHPRFGLARGFASYDHAPTRRKSSPGGERTADALVDRLIDWIASQGDRRFFASLHLIDPHLPYAPPESTRGRFADEHPPRSDLPLGNALALRARLAELRAEDRAFLDASYDEEVAFLAGQVARLLDTLERSGRLEHTLVVFTADHGEELFDHGGFEHGHSLHHELLRVPLIVWGPGVAAARFTSPVSLVDVFPTVLDALGLTDGEDDMGDLDGSSLWQALRQTADIPARTFVAEGTVYGEAQRALIDWPHKLIVAPASGVHALYDLDSDPGEQHDIAPDNPSLVRELEERLQRDFPASSARRRPAVQLDDEARASLRALGYLENGEERSAADAP